MTFSHPPLHCQSSQSPPPSTSSTTSTLSFESYSSSPSDDDNSDSFGDAVETIDGLATLSLQTQVEYHPHLQEGKGNEFIDHEDEKEIWQEDLQLPTNQENETTSCSPSDPFFDYPSSHLMPEYFPASSDIKNDSEPVINRSHTDMEGSMSNEMVTSELSPEEIEQILVTVETIKAEGNTYYKEKDYIMAIKRYSEAIKLLPNGHPMASILLSNRAACNLSLNEFDAVINDTKQVLSIEPDHLKCLYRRQQAYERTQKWQETLDDIRKLIELDPSKRSFYQSKVPYFEHRAKEKREKEQEEMMGQVKEMGNKFLGLFGLSIDNFKAEKDPATGSYKINFQN